MLQQNLIDEILQFVTGHIGIHALVKAPRGCEVQAAQCGAQSSGQFCS